MQWHTVLIATFIVSLSIVALTSYSDTAGWAYVFILLLAAMIVWPNFSGELSQILHPTPPIRSGQPQ